MKEKLSWIKINNVGSARGDNKVVNEALEENGISIEQVINVQIAKIGYVIYYREVEDGQK